MARIEISNRIEGAVDLEEAQILVAEVTVTAAEMQALATTVKLVVAAPGAGKALYAVWYSVEMLGTTSFGGVGAGDDLTLRNTNNAGDLWGTMETTGFLTLTTRPKRIHYVRTITGTENVSLVLGSGGAITGGSVCLVKVGYTVVEAE